MAHAQIQSTCVAANSGVYGSAFRDWHHGLTSETALTHSPQIIFSDSSLSI